MPINLTVSFRSVTPPNDVYKGGRKGTYDRVRTFSETPNTLLPRTRSYSGQCTGVHEISGVHRAPRKTFRVVRGDFSDDGEPEARNPTLFERFTSVGAEIYSRAIQGEGN
jgi:hypothetical protein